MSVINNNNFTRRIVSVILVIAFFILSSGIPSNISVISRQQN